jgi:hypothetical protein
MLRDCFAIVVANHLRRDTLLADDWRLLVAVFAALIALVSLLFTLRDRQQRRHNAILSALQGEKEAVAYIAFK